MSSYKKDKFKILKEQLVVWFISFIFFSILNYTLISIINCSFIVWSWSELSRVILYFSEVLMVLISIMVAISYYGFMYSDKDDKL